MRNMQENIMARSRGFATEPVFESDWGDRPCNIYLGSERNPRTGRWYDYWLLDSGDQRERVSYRYSVAARHGDHPADYGSHRLSEASMDNTHILAGAADKDFIFGMTRAATLGLYYLATGEKPLVTHD